MMLMMMLFMAWESHSAHSKWALDGRARIPHIHTSDYHQAICVYLVEYFRSIFILLRQQQEIRENNGPFIFYTETTIPTENYFFMLYKGSL